MFRPATEAAGALDMPNQVWENRGSASLAFQAAVPREESYAQLSFISSASFVSLTVLKGETRLCGKKEPNMGSVVLGNPSSFGDAKM